MADQSQTLNIPSLILVLVVLILTIRYFFFSTSRTTSSSSSSSSLGRRYNPEHVERVASMFPQIGRREIIWDLQRNGGSVTATTERILSTGLETVSRATSYLYYQPSEPPSPPFTNYKNPTNEQPPPSFQPPIPNSTPTPQKPSQSSHPDLITRYNLSSRLTSAPESPSPAPTWSNNKNERQALLQQRREEMVLNARRRLEEEERLERNKRGTS